MNSWKYALSTYYLEKGIDWVLDELGLRDSKNRIWRYINYLLGLVPPGIPSGLSYCGRCNCYSTKHKSEQDHFPLCTPDTLTEGHL